MALFHLEAKILGKTGKNGGQKNIEAIVAYRHCAKIDEFDYTKKSKQLVDSFMIFPNNFNEVLTNSAQIWANSELNQKGPKHNLEQAMAEFQKFTYVDFWKSAGKAEKRKDAQYCEELIISLQHELTLEENKANLKKLLEDNYTSKGKAADVCIHNSGNNLHAHVLITQRPIEGLTFDFQNPNGIGFIFGKKIRDQKFGGAGFKVDEITPIREQWANLCNASFRKRDLTHEISHLSLVKQKEVHILRGDYQTALELDREPSRTIHRSTPNFEQKIKARKIAKKNAIEENFKNIEQKINEYIKFRLSKLSPVFRTLTDRAKRAIKASRRFAIKQRLSKPAQPNFNSYEVEPTPSRADDSTSSKNGTGSSSNVELNKTSSKLDTKQTNQNLSATRTTSKPCSVDDAMSELDLYMKDLTKNTRKNQKTY